MTSIDGCSTSATAIVGLCVTTVACRSCGRCRAICSVVVPPSRITTWPRRIICAAARPIATFASGCDLLAAREVHDRGRGGQRAAVHALQPSGRGQLAQIAADGVLRQLQLLAHILGDDLALRLQDLEQVILALAGEHAGTMHEFS